MYGEVMLTGAAGVRIAGDGRNDFMTTFSARLATGIGVCLGVFAIISTSSDADAQTSSVARGKYIVNNVAMCPTCHSPASAQTEEARTLTGGPVP